MRKLLIAIGASVLMMGVAAGSASASIYKVDVRGAQKVEWAFDGEIQVGGCASEDGNFPVTRRWTGNGISQFTFRSMKPGQGVVMRDLYGKLFASFNAEAKATGQLTGSWVVSETHGGCPDSFSPSPGYIEDTSACGPQSWNMRLVAQNQGGYLWAAGQEDLIKPSAPESSRYDECPYALSSGPVTIGREGGLANPTACEPQISAPIHQLSWELHSLGRGIANVKYPIKARSAGKKTIVLSREVTKKCLIPVSNGAGGSKPTITVTVTTRLSATLRRTVK